MSFEFASDIKVPKGPSCQIYYSCPKIGTIISGQVVLFCVES